MARRDWITHDFGWKLFSLILAMVIWLTIHNFLGGPRVPPEPGPGDRLTYDDLPVLPVSASADVRDYRVVPPTVKVTVSGPPAVMAVLQANQIRAVVDLTGIESGKELRRQVDVSTPPGVTVDSVKPARVGVIIPPPPEKKP